MIYVIYVNEDGDTPYILSFASRESYDAFVSTSEGQHVLTLQHTVIEGTMVATNMVIYETQLKNGSWIVV